MYMLGSARVIFWWLIAFLLGGSWGTSIAQEFEQISFREKILAARKKAQTTELEYTLEHDGIERKYLVHVPKGYSPDKAWPLLFAFHGGGGSMHWQADDERYGLITKSDEEGFIAVFPNGTSPIASGMLATWNAGNCCAGARDKHVDDVGFVRKVLHEVQSRWMIDSTQIFATGMSNGGMFSYRLACEMSDVFSAIAAVAGTDGMPACKLKRPISILHIHAKNDDHVLFNGGAGPAAKDLSKEAQFRAVPLTIAKWSSLNQCSPLTTPVFTSAEARCEIQTHCNGQARVQLCVTATGGHSWPGSQSKQRLSKEEASQALSANDVMWNFFKRRSF